MFEDQRSDITLHNACLTTGCSGALDRTGKLIVMAKNWEHAAGILWPVLVDIAKRGKTLTYSDLAPLIRTNPLSVGKGLGPILFYCLENKLPPLTVLVVGKTSGVPGTGFIAWDIDNLDEAYAHVYGFNWNSVTNPFGGFGVSDSSESFARRLNQYPEQAGEVYSLIKVRGSAQKIFRLALLDSYEYQCAMCQFSFEEALEAAHILPWARCNHSQRISPNNGVLLCANHHKLFDQGYISISTDYKIQYEGEEFCAGDYSTADLNHSVALNGKTLYLPKNKDLWPSKELLSSRGL